MSQLPPDLLYTKDHEWIKAADDGTALIGITDHAQCALGDVTFIDLPKVGTCFAQGDVFGTVESVKAASDLYSPITCEVIAINTELNNSPDRVNSDAYGDAWMIKVRVKTPSELKDLLNAASYSAVI